MNECFVLRETHNVRSVIYYHVSNKVKVII